MPLYSFARAGFEAARRLPFAKHSHQKGLHGHSFAVHARLPYEQIAYDFQGAQVYCLEQQLNQLCESLNYRDLNDILSNPDDIHLANELKQQHPQNAQISLQSTANQGVQIAENEQAIIWRRFHFHAAHYLPNVPDNHQCGRLHGHDFQVLILCYASQASLASQGYDEITQAWQSIASLVNYQLLNQIQGLENPTSEYLSLWLWQQLQSHLPNLQGVMVHETPSCGAYYNGHAFHIWKDFNFDVATQYPHAPKHHPLSQVHGHTYVCRLHLWAPLDTFYGWTVDYGDVKALFNPIIKTIDHYPIHQRLDLAVADSAHLAQWIYQQCHPLLPHIQQVQLQQTTGHGSVYSRQATSFHLLRHS